MGKPGRCYAQWPKSGTEGQILHDSTFMTFYSGKSKQRIQQWLPGAEGWGMGSFYSMVRSINHVRWISYGALLYNIVVIVNIVYWKFVEGWSRVKCSYHNNNKKGTKKLGGDGYVFYLDCSDGITVIYYIKLIKFHPYWIWTVLCVLILQ
jgi:hypothetical protein